MTDKIMYYGEMCKYCPNAKECMEHGDVCDDYLFAVGENHVEIIKEG